MAYCCKSMEAAHGHGTDNEGYGALARTDDVSGQTEIGLDLPTISRGRRTKGAEVTTAHDGIEVRYASYSPTSQLRWHRRPNPLLGFGAFDLVLQQCFQGSDGSQKWDDVPIVSDPPSDIPR